jgi:hypothetical protein
MCLRPARERLRQFVVGIGPARLEGRRLGERPGSNVPSGRARKLDRYGSGPSQASDQVEPRHLAGRIERRAQEIGAIRSTGEPVQDGEGAGRRHLEDRATGELDVLPEP